MSQAQTFILNALAQDGTFTARWEYPHGLVRSSRALPKGLGLSRLSNALIALKDQVQVRWESGGTPFKDQWSEVTVLLKV